MLTGLKSKPKNQETLSTPLPENPKSPSKIDQLLKEEQRQTSSDYNKHFLRSLKAEKSDDSDQECPSNPCISLNPSLKPLQKLQTCEFCSENVEKALKILQNFQILLPKSGPLIPGHFLIVPIDHHIGSTDFDSSELDDFLEVKSKICDFYRENYGKKAVFIEFVRNFRKADHLVVEVLPMTESQLDSFYFTVVQELENSDSEWTNNKKVVFIQDDHLKGKIPSGFSYIYFDFDMSKGLAHVIENHRKFTPEYCKTLLAETLNLEVLFLRKKLSSVSLSLLQDEYSKKLSQFFMV
jgi:diadenosine tetraphosphate (Ap4A) HIT family hydrolase